MGAKKSCGLQRLMMYRRPMLFFILDFLDWKFWWKKIHRWRMKSKNVSGETAVILLLSLNLKNKLKRNFKMVLDPRLLKNVNFLLFWRSKSLVKSGNVEMSTCFGATSIAQKWKFQSSDFFWQHLVWHLVERLKNEKSQLLGATPAFISKTICQNTFCKPCFRHKTSDAEAFLPFHFMHAEINFPGFNFSKNGHFYAKKCP